MSNAAWPELESTMTVKAPEWTLRTESELHVERLGSSTTPSLLYPLQAKLKSIKKSRRNNSQGSKEPHRQDLADPDADEIQEGQEEADEGLWLLWNNKTSQGTTSQKHGLGIHHASHGVRHFAQDVEEPSGEQESQEDRENRLENAKTRAKHIEDYTIKERACSRTCCCIIS
ncbi:hypothetical protein BGX28_008388 [Mortierella sp. GBA30]|nr:hypothetical protein BGX28_008388 [Mortierella sp. GBA30]